MPLLEYYKDDWVHEHEIRLKSKENIILMVKKN